MKNKKHLVVAPLSRKVYSRKGFGGFTLAETLIVLVVLGIVASITIPPLVRRQIEASNRVKIKKAMSVYDLLLSKIAVENDIKSTQALKEWGEQTDENGVGCVNQRKYFKAVKGEGCQFMTTDKVWWDVTDITHPIIALKEGELDNPDSKTTFQLIAHFGPDGELRVNDIQWELTSNENLTDEEKEELEKLWAAITGKQTENSAVIKSPFDECKSKNELQCTINDLTYKPETITGTTVSETGFGDQLCTWNIEKQEQECPYISTSETGTFWVSAPIKYTEYESYLDSDSSTCITCKKWGYNDYYNAAARYCDEHKGRLPKLAELVSLGYDRKNNKSCIFAAEGNHANNAYGLSANGSITGGYKGDSCSVVCVGK